MLILDIGHTNIKILHNSKKTIKRFNVEDNVSFYKYLSKFSKTEKIIIGSVNQKYNKELKLFLTKNKYNFYFLTWKDFINKVRLNKKIDIREIGIDILSRVFYIDDTDYILVSNGTACVITYVSQQLDGVIIGNNILYDLKNLKEKTQLKNNYSFFDGLGTNTNDSINGFISNFFLIPILKLVDDTKVCKIYLDNCDKQIFSKVQKVQINSMNDMTILGYKKLLKFINI